MRKSYQELLAEYSKKSDRQAEIRKTAAQICERRKERGSILRQKAEVVKQEKAQMLKLLQQLKEHLKSYNDDEQRNAVLAIITQLSSVLEKYSTDLDSLASRFENSKIRVLSFGFKSQGKSLFTRLYTHITDENIISVKGKTDEDQTGATNIIRHNSKYTSQKPRITVYFRKESDILALVNNALNALSKHISKTDIPGTFQTYREFSQYLKSSKTKAYEIIGGFINDINDPIPSFNSAMSMLMSIFNPASDFSMVGSEEHVLSSSSEMGIYNNMQAPAPQRYLSVDHIDIELDLGCNNMFENFEICDTKGLSEDAGGSLIEDALVDDINHADAIFSIQKIQQDGGKRDDFINKLQSLADPKRKNDHIKSIQNRHFSIANVIDGISEKNVDNYEKKINQNNLANILYVGMLVDGMYNGTEINAQKFADSLILHMIGAIVDTTASLDDELIRACYDGWKTVDSLLSNLKSQLTDLSKSLKVGKEYSEYIRENVNSIRYRILRLLADHAQKRDLVLDNDRRSSDPVVEYNSTDNIFGGYTQARDNVFSENTSETQADEVDTTRFYHDHEVYDKIKSESRSIYYALTHHENDAVRTWKASEEIEEAVKYLLTGGSYVVSEGEDNVHCKLVDCDYIKVNGVSPNGVDVQTIGSTLDSLHHIMIENGIGENLAKFRMILSEEKKKDIVDIYQIVFNELHISDICHDMTPLSYPMLLECPIENSTIKKMCSFAKKNLDNVDSYTSLPTSFKLIRTYFNNIREEDPKKDGRCVLEFQAIEESLISLLNECKDSLAYEIESKHSNEKSPVEVCMRELRDFIINSDCLDGFIQLFMAQELSDNYLEDLERWGLLTSANRDEVKESQSRNLLKKSISTILEMPVVSTVY